MNFGKLYRTAKNYFKYAFISGVFVFNSLDSIAPTSDSEDISSRPDSVHEEMHSESRSDIIDDYKEKFSEPISGLKIPVDAGQISSTYGVRELGKKKDFHFGFDIAKHAGDRSESSKNIYSPEKGVVDEVGYTAKAGNFVKISHPVDSGTLKSVLCHLGDYSVDQGDTLRSLERIGEMGSTGFSTGDHLHFGVKRNGNFANPKEYIDANNEIEVNSIVGFDRESLKRNSEEYYAKLKEKDKLDWFYSDAEIERRNNNDNSSEIPNTMLANGFDSHSSLNFLEKTLAYEFVSSQSKYGGLSESGEGSYFDSRVSPQDSSYQYAASNDQNSLEKSSKDNFDGSEEVSKPSKTYRIQVGAVSVAKGSKMDYYQSKYGDAVQEHVMDVNGKSYYKYTLGADEGRDYDSMKLAMKTKDKSQAVVILKDGNPLKSVWG